MRPQALIVAVLAATLVAGCGSDDPEQTTTVERQEETAEKLPKLPRGWHEYVNRDAGFALGRPPGWAATDKGGATQFLAPDELVAMFISADRTSDALSVPADDFATRTLMALEGFEQIDPGEPKKFNGHYDGAGVEGTAIAAQSGVKQDLRVIALQREGVAAVTAVIAANAKKAADAEVDQAVEAVRTLRTQPVG